MLLKALIIEDEPQSAFVLTEMLNNLYSDIEVLEVANTLDKGIKIIQNEKPNIIFLDINVGTDCGFEIIRKTNPKSYEIIVVTAHKDHAFQAIKNSAVDFILKPYDFDDIKIAVEKAINSLQLKASSNLFGAKGNKELNRLTVNTSEGIIFIDFESIIYVKADTSYSEFLLTDDKKIVSTKNISYYESGLLQNTFFRIHKSYIINLKQIKLFQKGRRSGSITMNNNETLPVARDKKKELIEILKIK